MNSEDCVIVGDLLGDIFWKMQTLLDFPEDANYPKRIAGLRDALVEAQGVTQVLVVPHPEETLLVPLSERTGLIHPAPEGPWALRGALAYATTLMRPARLRRSRGRARGRQLDRSNRSPSTPSPRNFFQQVTHQASAKNSRSQRTTLPSQSATVL